MIVLTIIFLLIFLLLILPVGAEGEYSEDGFMLDCFFGPFSFSILPEDEKKKNKKKKRSRNKTGDKEKSKKGGSLKMILDLLPTALEAAGALKRRLKINKLVIHFVAASDDPYKTAMSYGYASAAMGMILPIFENNFKVKERDLSTDLSFSEEETTVYINVNISIRIGQIIYIGLKYGVKMLNIYMNYNKKTDRKAVN